MLLLWMACANAPGDAGVRRAASRSLGPGSVLGTRGATVIQGPCPGSPSFGSAVAGGDFDGDGYADLAVGGSSWCSGGAVWVFPSGSSGLAEEASVQLIGASQEELGRTLDVGDLDLDGYDDLVASEWGRKDAGAVYVFGGHPGGLPSSPTFTDIGTVGFADLGYVVAVVGDVDGDGFPDVAATSRRGETVSVYYSSATGLSASSTTVLSGSSRYFGSAVAGGDLDGDGYADVAVSDAEATVQVFDGSAAGVSSSASASLSEGGDFGQKGLGVAGDVDGDGFEDLLVGDHSGSVAYLYLGSASGIASAASWTVEGEDSASGMGRLVGGLGDLDGDGFEDFFVTEIDAGSDDEGRVGVYLGASSGPSTTADLAFDGELAEGAFGSSVCAPGDVDGDGSPDLLIGAVSEGFGRARFYAGGSTGPSTSAAQTWAGPREVVEGLGESLAAVGDVNGDGFEDLFAGLLERDAAALFYGSASGLSTSVGAEVDMDEEEETFGERVAGAGDTNGDGYADLLVGAPFEGDASDGVAYFYFGSASGPSGSPDVSIESEAKRTGYALAGAGDVDGDGFDDFLVGSYSSSGLLGLHLGSSGGPSSTPDVLLEGGAGSYLGVVADGAGDVDGDGYRDLLVGASGPDESYLFHGNVSGCSTTASATLASPGGSGAAGLGDLDGDGFDDVAVAEYAGGDGWAHVYIHHGSASGISTTPAQDLSGSVDTFGKDLAAGDLTGDGLSDLVTADPAGSRERGVVFLFEGSVSGLASTRDRQWEGEALLTRLGSAVAVGDFDADGLMDLAIGVKPESVPAASRVEIWMGMVDADGDGVPADLDCDDEDSSVGTNTWFEDGDGDGYGGASVESCLAPAGHIGRGGDCDDDDAAVHPGAVEVCGDGWTDEDCNGLTNDQDGAVVGTSTWYRDGDGDGYGDAGDETEACQPSAGWVDDAGDCDDSLETVHPGADELCNGRDDDCDGLVDDEDDSLLAAEQASWFLDADGDGYGDAEALLRSCSEVEGYVANALDCDDSRSDVHPEGLEICDGVDQDCDEQVDEDACAEDQDDTGDPPRPRPGMEDGCAGCASSRAPAEGLALLVLVLIGVSRRRLSGGA
jgi:hypothetical protein